MKDKNQQPPTKPEVTSVSPASGDPAGGTCVEISGEGFSDKALVKFGDSLALDVKYLGPTTIQATAPAHGEGAVEVSVQVDSRTGKLSRGFTYKACADQRTIFLLVLLAGALGGSLHSIRSFYFYVGNRDFKWSWVPMYGFRPLTGAALACIFFICVNGGIVNSQSPSNRLWIVGLAALVGLFSQQGFEKLKKIFEAIFTTVPAGADRPKPAPNGTTAITIDSPTGSPGKIIKITGTGFVEGNTTVQFGKVASTNVKVDDPTILHAVVPPQASPPPGGPVDVVVTVPGAQTLTLHGGFTYT